MCSPSPSPSPSPSRSPARKTKIQPPAAQWSCVRCTLSNPVRRAVCDACGASRPMESQAVASSSSSPSGSFSPAKKAPAWSCARCTLSNPVHQRACDACGASRPVVVDADADDGLDLDAVAGVSFLPLQRRSGKTKRVEVSDDGGVSGGASSLPLETLPRKRERVGVCDDGEGSSALQWISRKKERVEVSEVGGATGEPKEGDKKVMNTGSCESVVNKKAFKIMTYNVWFREDLELDRRMNALGDLIKKHNPDLICFQEVTPTIYMILHKSGWWQEYKCSLSKLMAMQQPYYCMQMSKLPVDSFDCIPFANSVMGRELCTANVNVGGTIKLVLATSHLESPCPAPPTWDQMYSKERVEQANVSLKKLGAFRNVIFCGDMNWDDKGDGPFPLPDGWTDAWVELKPGEDGWTYDTKANGMLSGNRKLQKRLDRFVCKLPDFKIDSIEMIGKDAIPGVTFYKDKKVRKEVRKLELPVLPSDHFGLVLSITHQAENV